MPPVLSAQSVLGGVAASSAADESSEGADDGVSIDPAARLIDASPVVIDEDIQEPVTSGSDGLVPDKEICLGPTTVDSDALGCSPSDETNTQNQQSSGGAPAQPASDDRAVAAAALGSPRYLETLGG